jgi:hypothetical protein
MASATISGSIKVGQTLTANANAVTGNPSPTLTYEWKVSGSNTAVSTTNTYTIASGDLGKTISVMITAANGVGTSVSASRTTAAVGQAPLNNLSGLSIRTASGALNLSPAFSPTQTTYSVTSNTAWVIITPRYTNAGQGVRVEGGVNLASGTESSRRLLQVGVNPIEIWSTAQSGERKTYIINVTLPAPANDLSGLSIRTSSGALNLSPAFSPTQLSYSVTTNTGWVIITPRYTNAGQGVRVEGGVNLASGTESSRRLLQVGANPIEIWSTAQSGGRKTYIINVTRTR